MCTTNNIPHETKNWAYKLFVEHPQLFLPVIEREKQNSQMEVEALEKIFDEFDVARGSRILDVSCGIGRHSVNLVKKGYQVVGYDPSALYIEKAKQWAKEELGVKPNEIRFLHGQADKVAEVLSINGETSFNAIIIMDNSLGYVSESQDVQTLKDIFTLAATNCVLITETENRDWRIRNFQPFVNFDFENLEIHETWQFNSETSVAESRSKFYEKIQGGNSLCLMLDLNTSLRLYSLHELVRIVNSSGWNYIRSFGGLYTHEPASCETPDILTVSRNV